MKYTDIRGFVPGGKVPGGHYFLLTRRTEIESLFASSQRADKLESQIIELNRAVVALKDENKKLAAAIQSKAPFAHFVQAMAKNYIGYKPGQERAAAKKLQLELDEEGNRYDIDTIKKWLNIAGITKIKNEQ